MALLLKGMYSYLDARENRRQPALNPLVQQTTADTRQVTPGDVAKFPEPHLETDEPREINDFRMQEEQTLHSYGWVDQLCRRSPDSDRPRHGIAGAARAAHPSAGRCGSAIRNKHGETSGAAVRYQPPAREEEVAGRARLGRFEGAIGRQE